MDKALKKTTIETIEDTYIVKLCKKYIWYMVFKIIDLVHHIMDIYGENTETYLNDNQKRFDKLLDTTMPIEKYSEIIDDCIHYVDGWKYKTQRPRS